MFSNSYASQPKSLKPLIYRRKIITTNKRCANTDSRPHELLHIPQRVEVWLPAAIQRYRKFTADRSKMRALFARITVRHATAGKHSTNNSDSGILRNHDKTRIQRVIEELASNLLIRN